MLLQRRPREGASWNEEPARRPSLRPGTRKDRIPPLDDILEGDPSVRSDLERIGFGRWLGAGLAATLVMTLITYLGPLAGLANVDIAGMLGAMLAGNAPQLFSMPWWAGMVWHFINGAVLFPLIYVSVFLAGRPTPADYSPAGRGTVWGLTLWFLLQALLVPMMGGGFFSRHMLHPGLVVLGSLLSHVGYGATLGGIARLRPARFIEITQNRAA